MENESFVLGEKKCVKCNEIKNLSFFYKDKYTLDGLTYNCKKCRTIIELNYKRSKEGVLSTLYSNNISNSKIRKRSLPEYSKDELRLWLFNNLLFDKLYDDWISNNYNINFSLSIDRKDNYKPYSLNNIQLMTWDDNRKKGHNDMKSGILKVTSKPQIPIIQLSLNGIKINEFISICDASRITGIHRGCIQRVLNGERKQTGGFLWKKK